MRAKKRRALSPGRFIALGFAGVILTGALLLLCPFTHNPDTDVSAVDALFTSTSAVCVTGLIAVDTADTFNAVGQTIVALLIQIGGLGVTSIGVGFIILSGRKINMRERLLAKESLNYDSFKGVLRLVRSVLFTTLVFEAAGTLLSFIVFSRDYPPLKALGISAFHAVAAFNNSGFDILGGLRNLTGYADDVLLNLTTCMLIVFGGLGFFVIRELRLPRAHNRRFSLHTKVVLSVTAALLAGGTLLLKLTDPALTWLQAFFQSTSARTAGFSTVSVGSLSSAGLFVLCILMFIGASPGSTGGGIKTTTFFVLLCAIFSASTNRPCGCFHRKLPGEVIRRAFTILLLALCTVCASTLFVCMLEPDIPFLSLFFEVVSAFGTVGLSTGITPGLSDAAKLVIIVTMYIGRLGPLTAASLWYYKSDPLAQYAQEAVTIG
ncbi:MAG: TrkH family potassium uptake protein [Oscillospiraceae bacterium]|nr:TrkH family potassium uptake protein [Oscillospiraceae bacterium]